MSSLREAILAASDLKRTEVKVPEWGEGLFVRELSGVERGELEAELAKASKAGKFREHYRALIVIASLCDAEGKRIFGYGDAEALSAKSGRVLETIGKAVDKLNAISEEEVEQIAKN